jgi:nucleotide-binding universal stress UspA family protein
MYRDLLIATDGNELGQRAADHGVELARELDATVHGLSVLTEGATTRDHIRADPEGEAEEALQHIKQSGDEKGVAVTTDVRTGDPCDAIVEYAEESEADLIVMGTTAAGHLDRILYGSTTQCVSEKATVPVLSVGEKAKPVFDAPEDATFQFYCNRCNSTLRVSTETKDALEAEGCIMCGADVATDAFTKLEDEA